LKRTLAALVCAALAGAPAAMAAPAATAPPGAGKPKPPAANKRKLPPPPVVTLSPSLVRGGAVQVTMPPVGLSLEYMVMAQQLGTGPCLAPALVAELQRLGSPPLELGGQSQDFTVPAGVPAGPPANWEAVTGYTLPSDFFARLHCLLSATRQPLTVGLNARSGQLAWAERMVAGAQEAATNGLDFSLGNEPDLYYLPNYASLSKSQPGEEALASGNYLQVAGYLRQALGQAPLIGPETSGPSRWRGVLGHVVETLHVQTVGVHMYPLSACRTPRAATLHGLLAASVGNSPQRLSWVLAAATSAKLPAIISEANSVSCGGKAGVSDGPASAVWAARFVLSALKTGFKEVRFHLSGNPYDPFVVRGAEVQRRPLEAALAALNQWLPVGSTLRGVAGVRGLVASAAATPSGTLLILDNQTAKAATVVVRGAPALRIQRLLAERPGLVTLRVSSPQRGVRLSVAPASLVAISATS
jgi:hypothetical protein